MSALAPGYLRIGGTMADRLIFNPHKMPSFKLGVSVEPDGGACAYKVNKCNFVVRPNFTMSGNFLTCTYIECFIYLL